MTRRLLPLAVLALAGCQHLESASASAPGPPDALDCALAEATGLGYAVADAEVGVFFEAERVGRTGRFDMLNVTAAQGRLVVQGYTEQVEENGRTRGNTSKRVRADAAEVAARCGTGASAVR